MNNHNLEQIFKNYIDNFEFINSHVPKNEEYYKWQIAKWFRSEMDSALASSNDELPLKLKWIRDKTENLIDSRTQPFEGLCKFSEIEPDTVRSMFRTLFLDDGGDVSVKQEKILEFLSRSHALRDRYYPNSFRYNDDFHSVTGYMFLYDPDHNYLFKATNAREFADCISFYDDWGSGDSVKLDVYYRMCDQLVKAIKSNKALLATDKSRFSNGWGIDPDSLHPDPEKHILAFDLIFCASSNTYGLFKGATYKTPTSKERQIFEMKKEKAKEYFSKYEYALKRLQILEAAKNYVNEVYKPGTALHHTSYGEGIVLDNDGKHLKVEYLGIGIKNTATFIAAANRIITVDLDGYSEKIDEYAEYLKYESEIKTLCLYWEANFAPYAEFLD